jgi:2-aminoadipate transaminase
MVAYEVGKGGFLDEHVKVIRRVYKERRDVMLETMEEIWPACTSWTKPQGGMFLWGILPAGMDASEVIKKAIERKVAFVPGAAFHANNVGKNTMRLNFSYSSPDVIREGSTRLGLLLRELVSTNVSKN